MSSENSSAMADSKVTCAMESQRASDATLRFDSSAGGKSGKTLTKQRKILFWVSFICSVPKPRAATRAYFQPSSLCGDSASSRQCNRNPRKKKNPAAAGFGLSAENQILAH